MQNIRAFVPVLRDPSEVEVDGRPEDIGDPGAIMLLRLKKPLSILDQDQRAERGTIYNLVVDLQILEGGRIGRCLTSCRGTNTIIGVRNLVDFKIE
jgi:hypothetical protein